ncbi:MAG TPA: hypothetical protein V6C71_26045 [Coleofasciculaceae cyanobacterium]|jgi:REP element-mobilizing transposase RayT
MKYNPDRHHRRSLRLPGYDYSQPGAYFVTICAYQRQCLFGEIIDGQMILNQYGAIIAETYQWLCQQHSYLHTDEWIVMPNHFHAIMVITDKPCRGVSRREANPLGETPLRSTHGIPTIRSMRQTSP